jgi:hypothetical protein
MFLNAAWGSQLAILANVPGHFTWEPDPQSGSESRVSTDDTGRIGSVTLKTEGAWPRACLLF